MSAHAELLSFADTLADAARAAILPYFRAQVAVENKSTSAFDPVTPADRAAEAAMRALIEERYPSHGILGEEDAPRAVESGLCWVLDPIDGTRAFVAGLPLWGTLIALVEDGEPVLGIIDQGFSGERFRGYPGGADLCDTRGRRPLSVRACERLADAVLSTTDPRLFQGSEADAFTQLSAEARITRFGCDCYAYAMVALGSIDLVVESGLAPWDVAALIPVVEGAGGSVRNFRGERLSGAWLRDKQARVQVVAAGDARVRDTALERLALAARG